MSNVRIAAVIVTFNRLPLLKESIDCIRLQSRVPDNIIVVNNSSTDGTREWLAQQRDLTVITQANAGSAGGQYTGIKTAYDLGFDWMWCMDDDCMPEYNALRELEQFFLTATARPIGFLASRVLWSDSSPHRMNLPGYFYNKRIWNFIGDDKFNSGCHAIDASSFVSCLFNAQAIKQVGLPNPNLFIWYDDLEYTIRFRLFGNYFIAKSTVIHKTPTNTSPALTAFDNGFDIKKYYGLRNFCFIYRTWNKIVLLRFICEFGYRITRAMLRHQITFTTVTLYVKAIFDGLCGRLDQREFL